MSPSVPHCLVQKVIDPKYAQDHLIIVFPSKCILSALSMVIVTVVSNITAIGRTVSWFCARIGEDDMNITCRLGELLINHHHLYM